MARPKKEEDVIEVVKDSKSKFSKDDILLARKIFGEKFHGLLDAEPEDRNILIYEAIEAAKEAKEQREVQKKIFETLSKIDVTPYIKTMNEGGKELSYLPWAAADKLVKQIYPLMEKKVIMFPDKEGTLHPYRYDRVTGNFTVHTEITIEGLTIGEDLVVMDNNIPVRAHSYTVLTRWGEYTIPPINDNMINKTKRRCFVKNLAQFGLGIDIFFSDTVEDAEEKDVEMSNVPDPVAVPEQYAQRIVVTREATVNEDGEIEMNDIPPKTVVIEKTVTEEQPETEVKAETEPAAEETAAEPAKQPEPTASEEVIEKKAEKPAKKTAAASAAKKAAPAEPEKPQVTDVPEEPKEMTVEDALDHVFANGGDALKGHKVRDLVIGTKDAKKSTNILRSFANCGVGDDKRATKIVLDAIEKGDLRFVLASEQETETA